MDPYATIRLIADLLAELDNKPMPTAERALVRFQIYDHVFDLGRWVVSGGFLPAVTGPILGLSQDGTPITHVDDHTTFARYRLCTAVPGSTTQWIIRQYAPFSGDQLNSWLLPIPDATVETSDGPDRDAPGGQAAPVTGSEATTAD